MIISKTTAGLKDGSYAKIGKFSTPLKAYVLQESNRAASMKGPASWLCTRDKSDRFAESSVGTSRASGLIMTNNGDKFPLVGEKESEQSSIYMLAYSREEVITHADLQDAVRGPSAEMRSKVKSLSDDYYVTENDLATLMMMYGTKTHTYYTVAGVKKRLPLPAPNGHPLFYKAHEVGPEDDVQSNIFYHKRAAGTDIDVKYLQTVMSWGSLALAQLLDGSGRATGFYANTMVVPGNRGDMLEALRQAAGSPSTDSSSGGASNNINIHFGNWDIVPLLDWRVPEDSKSFPIIFMSSVAREQLRGNMMYEREECSIRDWIDEGTRNYCWSAYARLGIGHHTYKHALYFETLPSDGTTLWDGQTAADAATLIQL